MRGRLFLAIIMALLIGACQSLNRPEKLPAAQAGAARPALWKVADADTTIYLFGTIHLLPRDFKWMTPAFEKVNRDASELVLEIADMDDPQKTAQAFMSLGIAPDLPPLASRVPAEKQPALETLVGKAGVPPMVLDRLETWAAAITLTGAMMKDLGLSTEDGVERVLLTRFRKAGKPVTGLETSEQQLGYFDALPEEAQRLFLTSLVDEQADMKAEFDKMITAWASGDDKAIAISFDDELRLSKELADVLIRKRNQNWTDWLEKRLDRPGTILVAVGAGHLAGDDSVQRMLAKRGIKSMRVQ